MNWFVLISSITRYSSLFLFIWSDPGFNYSSSLITVFRNSQGIKFIGFH
jgi:hypothetical protein